MSFRSARKISSYLLRAKLYPLEEKVGSEKCGKSRCEVCLNIEETDILTSTATVESLKINHGMINSTGMITVWFFFSHVRLVGSNMSGKPLMISDLDGANTKAMIAKMHVMKHVYKNIPLKFLRVKVILVFLELFS